jgi:membrane fusion protein, heavy metal efflux system
MRRTVIWTIALVATVGIGAGFTDKFDHLFGMNGEPAKAEIINEAEHGGEKDEHGEQGGHHEQEGQKDENEERGGSEIRLTDAQVKLAGIKSVEAILNRVDLTVRLTGEVRVNETLTVHVTPRVPGFVRSVRSFLGDNVEKGSVMAILDSRELADAKSAYIASRERTKLSQTRFERKEKLWNKRILSKQAYLDSQSALAETRIAERAAAQKLRALGISTVNGKNRRGGPNNSLTRFEVVAPLSGTIIEKHVTTGESVDEKEAIFLIADLRTVWVIASVNEKDIARVEKGQSASVTTNAYPKKTFKGQITWIADTLDERTRTLKIRIKLDNPLRLLKPGMFVRADVSVGVNDGVLTVPSAAVRRQGGETIVFVDEGGGRFERRDVALGVRSGGVVEVRKGLKPGERVVAAGSFTLKSELEKEGFGGGHGH